MILRLSTFVGMAGVGATTFSGVIDLKHWGLVALFFVINLLAYEFIVFGAGALAIAPFCREDSKFSEDVCDCVMTNCMRLCFIVTIVLMILWCADVFRLIPVPG